MPVPRSLEDLDELGAMLRRARGAPGEPDHRSQEAVAAELGIVQSYLSAIERGSVNVDAEMLERFERVLGLDLAALTRAASARKRARKQHGPPIDAAALEDSPTVT